MQVWSRTQGAASTDENPEGKPPILCSWHAHQGPVVTVEYLARDQGALLLSASEDCTARLWTLNGQYIGMFGQVSIVEFYVYNTLLSTAFFVNHKCPQSNVHVGSLRIGFLVGYRETRISELS